MALKISREMPFGAGSRGFRFENHADSVEDRKQYEEGRSLEEGRFHEGTLAQKVFQLLSNPTANPQHEARSARVLAPAVARRSVRRKSRKSAA